ncbi:MULTISPECIES: GtrA family protein [Clostridium]|uniref:GtrA family protein n=1 Tax=Clostridium TaxID=1485 RepID=UPI001EED8603|nr:MULTISPECIES: GtrA family protein [Clostridium]
MLKSLSKIKTFLQLACYALIGTSNIIIDVIVLNILWHLTGLYSGNINYFFKFISILVYSTSGYFLNRKFTFKAKASNKSYFRYVSLLFVLGIFDAKLLMLLNDMNPLKLQLNLCANFAAVFSSIITGSLGFVINKMIIFKKQHIPQVHKA